MSGKEAKDFKSDQRKAISKITASADELLESIENFDGAGELSEMNDQILDFFNLANSAAVRLSGVQSSKVTAIITKVDKKIARRAKQLSLGYVPPKGVKGSSNVKILSAQIGGTVTKEPPSAARGAPVPAAPAEMHLRQTPAQARRFEAMSREMEHLGNDIDGDQGRLRAQLEKSMKDAESQYANAKEGTLAFTGQKVRESDVRFRAQFEETFAGMRIDMLNVLAMTTGDLKTAAEELQYIRAASARETQEAIRSRKADLILHHQEMGRSIKSTVESIAELKKIDQASTKRLEAVRSEIKDGLETISSLGEFERAVREKAAVEAARAAERDVFNDRLGDVLNWIGIPGNDKVYERVVSVHPELALPNIKDWQSMGRLDNMIWEAWLGMNMPELQRAYVRAEQRGDSGALAKVRDDAWRNFFRLHNQKKDGFSPKAMRDSGEVKLTIEEMKKIDAFVAPEKTSNFEHVEGMDLILAKFVEAYSKMAARPPPPPAEWDESLDMGLGVA